MNIEPLRMPMRKTEKPRVRIRGIYATALTKLFLDKGFEIIQPSKEIAERFSLPEERYLSPEIDITDLEDLQGVNAESLSEHTDSLINMFFEELPDVIIKRSKVQKGAVYKGIVYRPAPQGGFIVKLSINLDGWLPPEELREITLKLGDPVVVEVKEIESEHGLPRVTTKVTVPGDFAVLISGGDVKVSHKIKGEERQKLIEIGKILKPEDWGIIWRTGAMNAEIEELQEEIEILQQEAEKLKELAESAPALVKLREGFDILEIRFPGLSKKKLDELRSQVFPTVKGHHWLKSIRNGLTEIVDFSEKYLAKSGVSLEKIDKSISKYLLDNFLPRGGQLVKIHHLKPNGREVILGPAKVMFVRTEDDTPEFILYRRFKPGGHYDGIGAPKEPGDYGITVVKLFQPMLFTAYFDVANKLKGIYLNINTPIEAYGDGFRYIDLEVDVVYVPDEGVKVIDNEKLKKHVEAGILSPKILDFVAQKVEEYTKFLEEKGHKLASELSYMVREKLEESMREKEGLIEI